ncbi:hypothetical protein F4776DRAFT_661480 [Hypoxylon sp. NC0597]|nr:hypothetical protein F4776DRAFT_661480 [Hypoxylon sp. NC0597]
MGHIRPLCIVCDTVEGKYKCTQCNLYTCSLTCFREHRDNHPPVESSTQPQPNSTPAAPPNSAGAHDGSQDSLPIQENTTQPATFKRSEIADMPEYKALTQRYPNLEYLLWNIAAATDPPSSNGVSNGKHGVPPGSNKGYRKTNQPWTKDMGYENGIEVLRRTRDNPGDDRDALREYCELVRIYSARRESANTEANIRQQRAKEDAKAIGELIKAEKSDV